MKHLPVKPVVDLSVLDALDIRVGTILRVFQRTILVGMKAERENPREIEGRQALFVVNLAPRKMAGIVSEGMLFDIGYANGILPVLAQPERPVPNGACAG